MCRCHFEILQCLSITTQMEYVENCLLWASDFLSFYSISLVTYQQAGMR